MSGKTGGNKKVSSPSTVRYWQRAQMSKFSETHRAKRIARHAKRMGLNEAQIKKATNGPLAPEIKLPEPLRRVILDHEVKEHCLLGDDGVVLGYPSFIIDHGVIVNVVQAFANNTAPIAVIR